MVISMLPKKIRMQRIVSFILLLIVEGLLCVAQIWSVYQPYIIERFNMGNGSASRPYSVNLAIYTIGQLIAGAWIRKGWSTKKVINIGTLASMLGLFLMMITPVNMSWSLNLTFGVLVGIGTGITYNGIYVAVVQWFPEKRGTALGLVATSVGITGLLMTFLVNKWLGKFGFTKATLIFFITFAVFSLTGGIFAKMPPKEMKKYIKINNKTGTEKNYTAQEMIKTKEFLLFVIYLTVALVSYRMAAPMTITMGMDRGVSNEVCVLITCFNMIANTCGRFFVPIIAEKLSRNRMLIVIFLINTVASVILIFARGWLYVICIPVLAFCFGGFLGINPALSVDYFGSKNAGQNNSILSIGSSIITLIMPSVVSIFEKTVFGYAGMFTISSLLTALGLFATIKLNAMKGNKKVEVK